MMDFLSMLFRSIFGNTSQTQTKTQALPRNKPKSTPPKASSMALKNQLVYRCLSLTAKFETGKKAPRCFSSVSGNFDKMGISFGALQWNLGQRTLQPLLRKMIKRHPEVIQGVFKAKYPTIVKVASMGKEEAVEWANSIQTQRKNRLNKSWLEMFQALGAIKECQQIQLQKVKLKFKKALEWCGRYRLKSERSVALMFDIRTQNGSIPQKVRDRIKREWDKIPEEKRTEVRKMVLIANCRAEAAKPRWVEDVRIRKLLIAKGQGKVHGITYNLREQFNITLKPFKVSN